MIDIDAEANSLADRIDSDIRLLRPKVASDSIQVMTDLIKEALERVAQEARKDAIEVINKRIDVYEAKQRRVTCDDFLEVLEHIIEALNIAKKEISNEQS